MASSVEIICLVLALCGFLLALGIAFRFLHGHFKKQNPNDLLPVEPHEDLRELRVREEAVQRREEHVRQREEAARMHEEGGNTEMTALRARERELIAALDERNEELENVKMCETCQNARGQYTQKVPNQGPDPHGHSLEGFQVRSGIRWRDDPYISSSPGMAIGALTSSLTSASPKAIGSRTVDLLGDRADTLPTPQKDALSLRPPYTPTPNKATLSPRPPYNTPAVPHPPYSTPTLQHISSLQM